MSALSASSRARERELRLNQLRDLVQRARTQRLWDTAAFYQDKLVAMLTASSAPGPEVDAATVTMAEIEHSHGAHERAYELLEQRSLLSPGSTSAHIQARVLGAQCKMALNEWDHALHVLGDEPLQLGSIPANAPDNPDQAALSVLRGRCYESLENRVFAAQCYEHALSHDAHCAEAWQRLLDGHLLTPQRERQVLARLRLPRPEEHWLRSLFAAKLTPMASEVAKETLHLNQNQSEDEALKWKWAEEADLAQNGDVLALRALRCYLRYRFEEARRLTAPLILKGSDATVVLVHVSALFELEHTAALFKVAHELAHRDPQDPRALYALGCYYLLSERHDIARRTLALCHSNHSLSAAAWLACGHSFAAEGEHEQALASYRHAQRLLSASHVPALCIGVELSRAHNLPLALHALKGASELDAHDPLIAHELGTVHFRNKNYTGAVSEFTKCLDALKEREDALSAYWEPTLVNLALAHRRLGELDRAAELLGLALQRKESSSAHAALGFTRHLLGELESAIESYTRALALQSDEPVATAMLPKALDDLQLISFSDMTV